MKETKQLSHTSVGSLTRSCPIVPALAINGDAMTIDPTTEAMKDLRSIWAFNALVV